MFKLPKSKPAFSCTGLGRTWQNDCLNNSKPTGQERPWVGIRRERRPRAVSGKRVFVHLDHRPWGWERHWRWLWKTPQEGDLYSMDNRAGVGRGRKGGLLSPGLGRWGQGGDAGLFTLGSIVRTHLTLRGELSAGMHC